jgi:histone deacetylase 1/2
LRDYTKHKFEPRSLPCIFFCYHTSYKGFRCLDPVSHRVFITRHARFDENVFPFSSSSIQPSSAISDFIAFHDPTLSHLVISSTNSSAGHSSPSSVTSSMPCKSCSLDLLPSSSSSISVPLVPTPQEEQLPAIPIASASHHNSHSMITRGKTGISKSKPYSYVYQILSSPLLSSLLVMRETKSRVLPSLQNGLLPWKKKFVLSSSIKHGN